MNNSAFRPTKRFKQDYNRLFRKDSGSAKNTTEGLEIIFEARFNHPAEYSL